jgi:hypothetical protein
MFFVPNSYETDRAVKDVEAQTEIRTVTPLRLGGYRLTGDPRPRTPACCLNYYKMQRHPQPVDNGIAGERPRSAGRPSASGALSS